MTFDERSFVSGTDTLSGLLAIPDGTGPFPAVVVIHEVYGLNDNIQDITKRLAAEGYVAFAVDLFANRNRAVCIAKFLAGALFNSLEHGGINDLKAALDYLSQEPAVNKAQVGAIGFCMGGGFALAWACTDTRLHAIAPFYSMNPRPLNAVARACPVVASFPEKDYTAKGAKKLESALLTHGVPHDIKVYAGAKHSFFNDRGNAYDAAASEDAWERTLAFFDTHLRQ